MTTEEYLIKRIEELEKLVKDLTRDLEVEKTSKYIYFQFNEPCPACEYKINYDDGIITVEKINNDK